MPLQNLWDEAPTPEYGFSSFSPKCIFFFSPIDKLMAPKMHSSSVSSLCLCTCCSLWLECPWYNICIYTHRYTHTLQFVKYRLKNYLMAYKRKRLEIHLSWSELWMEKKGSLWEFMGTELIFKNLFCRFVFCVVQDTLNKEMAQVVQIIAQ